MPRKINTKDFIEKAQSANNGKYDYSLTEYINSDTKVKVICKEHGVFLTRPADHVRGHGCPDCANHRKLAKEEFVHRAKKVHGDKYDYSAVEYKGNKEKVVIVCQTHGEFLQIPNSHLSGKGCGKCAGNTRKTKEDFIFNSNITHDFKYDYSSVVYYGNKRSVEIVCPVHGEFKQVAFNHENGAGCPECTNEKLSDNYRREYESFLLKAVELHNNKYKYNFNHSVLNKDIVKITCPIHGGFEQRVGNHLAGKGCPSCGFETGGFNRSRFDALVEKKGRGILYVLKLFSENETFIKIGITTRVLSHRVVDFPYQVEVIHEEICENGAFMFDLETHLHRKFKLDKYAPEIEFGGFTECFNVAITDEVVKEISRFKGDSNNEKSADT